MPESKFLFRNMFTLHQGVVNNIAFAPEISHLATCGGDGLIKIIDTNKYHPIASIKSHQDWVDDIKFSEDSLNLFSIGRDNELRIWRTTDYQCLINFSAIGVNTYPISETANLVATFNKNNIQIKNTFNGRIVSQINSNAKTVVSTCFSDNDKFFAIAYNDGAIRVFSPYTGELLCTLMADFLQISSIIFSPSLEMIATASNEGLINIWLIGDQRKIISYQISHYKITSLQFTADNQYLLIGDLRGDLFAIDIAQNTHIFTDSRHSGGITTIKICHALNQFAVGALDGNVSFYQLYPEKVMSESILQEDPLHIIPGLNELIKKASPIETTSNNTFKVVNKASSIKTKRVPLPTPLEISTNKIPTNALEEQIKLSPKAITKEWRIGDAIDEMLNVFGYAKGGMGAVYFVRHRNWQVKLAMKSPLLDNINEEFVMQRFIREATTWISLGVHPNIASCFFVKKIEGIPRIFIEYVENGSLYDWIYKGKLNSLELILKFSIQFCIGMEYAHRRGVIHRDIKPSNCLISEESDLKITDFGLVKMAQHPEEPITRNIESLRKKIRRDITTDNSAMGTPEYMSPEQWESSNEVGPESDIYSFGVMLFEMLCSRKPFLKSQEDGMLKMLQLHSMSEPPNPEHFIKKTPFGLKKIILRCLQKNITARYQNFNDILFDLKKIYQQFTKKEYSDHRINATHINPETRNNYSISLLELGFINEADEMLQRAKASYADNFPIHFNFHLRQWKSRHIPDSTLINYIQNKIKDDPENDQILQILCILLLYREEYKTSIEKILQFKNYKNNSYLLNLLAISLIMTNQSEEGMKYFYLASQVAPPGPEILLTYASAFFFRNDKAAAKELYDSVIHKYPQTYKNKQDAPYTSEYQAMKSLLVSHYPGLPLIANLQIPLPYLNTNIFSLNLTKNADYLLLLNEKKHLFVYCLKELKYIANNIKLSIEATITPLAQKNVFAVFNGKTIVKKDWLDLSEKILIDNLKEIKNYGFTVKDSYLYIVQLDNTLLVKNLFNNTLHKIPFESKINCIATSYQENYLAIGFGTGKIKVYSLEDMEVFMEATHVTAITSLAFAEEGVLLSGHEDNLILEWDLLMNTHSEIIVTPYPNCKAILPNLKENPHNASKFIAIFKDNYFVIWHRQEHRNLMSFERKNKLITFSPLQQQFVIWTEKKELELGLLNYPNMPLLQYIYCKPSFSQDSILPEKSFHALIDEGKEHMQANHYPDAYIAFKEALSVKGFERSKLAIDLLYSIYEKGEAKKLINIWFDYFIPERININTDILHSNEKNKITFFNDKTLIRWDLLTKETRSTNTNISSNIAKLKWLFMELEPTCLLLNFCHELIKININIQNQTKIALNLRGNCIDFCIVYQYLCILDSTGLLLVMDLNSEKELFSEELGKSAKQIHEYLPGKNILIVYENFLQIFSLELRTNQRNFKGPKAPIKNIAISPFGRFLAQTNIDGSSCIWNAFTSQRISNLPFNENITAMQFSKNSAYIAIGDVTGGLSVVDMNTESIVFRFKNVLNPITKITFSNNNRYLIASNHEETKIAIFELVWEMQFSQ